MKTLTLRLDDLELMDSMPSDQLGRMIREAVRYAGADGAYEPTVDDADRLAWVTMRRIVDKTLKKAISGKMGGQAKATANEEKKPQKKPKKPTTKRFVPPTEEQIRAYCQEKGYTHVNPLKFIACYESKGWMVGRTRMKSWQATVTKWELDSFDNPTNPVPVNRKPTKTVVQQQYQQREYTEHTDPMDWMRLVMDDQELANEAVSH